MSKVTKLGSAFVSWDLSQVTCLFSSKINIVCSHAHKSWPSLPDEVASPLKTSFPKFRPSQELLLSTVRGQGGQPQSVG